MKKRKFHNNGFTLVELLVAMMVCVITLTAVAALAFAMGSADDSSDDTSQKQAQLRFATLRITELIRHSKLVCSVLDDDVLLWRADDNGNGLINVNELVFIERGSSQNFIRLCGFNQSSNPKKDLVELRTLTQKQQLINNGNVTYTTLVPECANVRFRLDVSTPPITHAKFVSISFDLVENDVVHQYQINASLRSWAGNLLSPTGDMIVIDDD